ncbi:hypothetical protein EZ456_16360 [Pedobacter psychrodurus]|uniref:Uncharacterized protein n=1 Tax=Pedobacter psychrodurus TaxID=2530456 RepID=A0A4R0PUX3_9SPHI|nr:hypothetical protein [Pedobacter psychrodurus]TCD25109.1 hypothetical protein EZ456_16360 [Pedobacter psychrodurus]
MNIESFYTGCLTAQGEKIYLGDKIRGKFFYKMQVQYEMETKSFVLVSQNPQSPYRKYLLSDLEKIEGLNIVGNQLFFKEPKVGEKVKITVDNKSEFFPFGSMVEIMEVTDEWNVLVKSSSNGQLIMLKVGEFLEDRSTY